MGADTGGMGQRITTALGSPGSPAASPAAGAANAGADGGSSRVGGGDAGGITFIAAAAPSATPEAAPQRKEVVRNVVPGHFYESRWCTIINPRSQFINVWDLLLCFALALTATATPYEAAFIPLDLAETEITSPFLFYMNRVLDVYFVADFVLSFFVVAQVDASSFASPKLKDNARKYARTWLAVDLISSIPFDFIVFSMIQYGDTSDENGIVTSVVEVVSVETLNFLRAVRLLKLMRLFRVAKIFKRLRDTYGMSYRTTALAASFGVLFWCCHLFACAWKLVSEVSSANSIHTWLFQVDLYDSNHFEQYTTSFYWGMMTLTSTGYGNIPPGNDSERGFAVAAMLLGAFLFTRLISQVNASGTSEATSRYRLHRDHLNDLLKLAGCDQAQAVKIRKFFRLSFCRIQHERNAAVLSQMSQRQKGKFVQDLYCTPLSSLSVFREPSPAEGDTVMDRHTLFINAISEKLVARVYPAFEQLVCHGERTSQPTCHMYIIRRGLLGSQGRVYRANHILGEDIVCTNFERQYTINALTFVSTLTLSAVHLHEILANESFSFQRQRVRKASIITSVRARLHSMSRMVRIIISIARMANARPLVSIDDLFDAKTGRAILVTPATITARFHVEQRARPVHKGGGTERVVVLRPEFRAAPGGSPHVGAAGSAVRRRQPNDVTVEELVAEVRALDVQDLTPDEAKRRLRFYQRVRDQLLFTESKSLERKLSLASAGSTTDDNADGGGHMEAAGGASAIGGAGSGSGGSSGSGGKEGANSPTATTLV